MPDRQHPRRPGGFRDSVIGRVDWSCWLAAAGLLFLTVVSMVISFAILGVITAILAVGLVVFDSWVNRPKGPRAASRAGTGGWRTGAGRDTGWRSEAGFRGTPPPPQRGPRGAAPGGAPGRFRNQPIQPQPNQPRGNQPRGNQMPQPPRRQQPQPQRGMPPRQPQQNPPFRPQPGQANGQPQRGPQGQPPRPPFRPAPPEPGRGQDYQARR
jgi:hypothetical protein